MPYEQYKLCELHELWTPPPAAIAPDKLVSRLRPPCASFIGQDRLTRLNCPIVEDALDESPCGLYLVTTSKERRVANHAIEYQPLICLWWFSCEGRPVEEIHVDRPNLHLGTRHFCPELERNPFIRLNTQNEDVWLNLSMGITAFEDHERCLFELNGDFRDTFGQSFACAEVEWDTCPAPVIDERLQGNKGFCGRCGGDTGLFQIAWNLASSNPTSSILRANSIGKDIATN